MRMVGAVVGVMATQHGVHFLCRYQEDAALVPAGEKLRESFF